VHGRPTTVADLVRHNCLMHTVKSGAGVWKFAGDPPQEIRVRGTVRSNLGDALKQGALLGAGISLDPYYMVSEDLRAGTLVALLPDSVPGELDICVVFSTRRNMPTRVRHLLEFLKEWSRHPPEWASPAGTGGIPPAREAELAFGHAGLWGVRGRLRESTGSARPRLSGATIRTGWL